MESIVKQATLKDVDSIVKIHKEAFEGFFLTSLGDRFLRLYYSSFIESNRGVVYVAAKGMDIVGFSATSYISKGFNLHLIKKNLFKFGIEAFRLLFVNSKALMRLIENLNKESNDANVKDDGQYAELYSIAVSPSYQGEGIGKILLTVTESDIRDHNNQISLTTDFYNNDKTISFYHTLGYNDYYVFVTYPDRKMWRMIKNLK